MFSSSCPRRNVIWVMASKGVLRECADHVDASVGLALLMSDLGDVYFLESMKALLKAVATLPVKKEWKEKFALLVKKPGGMKTLQIAMGEAWEQASAVFYVANVCREWGATNEAVQLMEHCCDLDPSDPQLTLTLAHMLENKCQYDAALKLMISFVKNNENVSDLHLTDVAQVMTQIKGLKSFQELEVIPLADVPPMSPLKRPYRKNELHVLAILFTIIKILYIRGDLSVLPALTRLLDPLHQGKDLHLTNIRNEAAFYFCISKAIHHSQDLLTARVKPERYIYHVGDSHCITSAWQPITLKGDSYAIHPVLSTGTKIWHLRPEGVFYPKENFFTAIKSVPDEATVVMNFGEIDCREGLLKCVEKCKYDSLDEAVDNIVDIYHKLMSDLYRDHKWTIFVHPVPPVLDITRSTVMKFNSRLRKKLQDHPFLTYLDIADSLLTEDKKILKKEYEFDFTHIHPGYSHLLENALNRQADSKT